MRWRRRASLPPATWLAPVVVAGWLGVPGCDRGAAPEPTPAPAGDAMWRRHPLAGAPGGARAGRALVLWGSQGSPAEAPGEGDDLIPSGAAPSGEPGAAGDRSAAGLPPALQQALDIAPNRLHDIQIRLSVPAGSISLSQWLDDAVASGQIQGEASLAAARADWVADRRAGASRVLDPPAAAVSARGGRVLERYPMLMGLRVAVTREMLLDLLRRFPVTRVDESEGFAADAGLAEKSAVSRGAVAAGHQLAQLSESGPEPGAPRLHMAMWEYRGWPYADAAAWRRGGLTALDLRLHGCGAPGCGAPSAHASATLAVLRADLLGLRSLTVHAHAIGPTSLARLIDDTIASVDDIRVVSMSASLDAAHDWDCRGTDLVSRDVDALFEAGILVVKSAGNGGSSATGCTVGPPGAATTVLTVAALAAERDDLESLRRAPVLPQSAIGGAADPGERAVIGLAAQGCRRESIADTGREFVGCGTSFSTPTVSAAALLQLAFWERTRGTAFFHHRPGALMALLLAMGDGFAPAARQGGDARADVGFDRRVGAGRLRLRRFDRAGLDAPWGYAIADICVPRGRDQVFPGEDGVVLPVGADVLKAALFWYDSSLDPTGRMNDLDLAIERAQGDPAPGRARRWLPIASSAGRRGNKERAIARGVGGERLRVVVRGTGVTTRAADPACGQAQRAYLAYFFEDSRRDDPDGPAASDVAAE